MILRTHTKQPRDEKDYDVDYAPWLVGEDSLDEVTTTITCLTDPSDTSLVCAADPPMTATRAKFWISGGRDGQIYKLRSEEHTSELQSLMRTSYAVFCLKKKIKN